MNNIPNICENLYLKLLKEIPQFENGNILWILNGSILCNILANIEKINDELVSENLKEKFKKFARTPKGDIDICYKADRPYKFDLTSKEVLDFYSISEEQRTYNFVDSNSELTDNDIAQLCKYKTINGLEFYAKKPEYLFLYKFKELVAMFHNEILNNDLDIIVSKRKNIIRDVKVLHDISCEYIGYESTNNLLFLELKNISGFFHKLYEDNKNDYTNIIDSSLKLIVNDEKKQVK